MKNSKNIIAVMATCMLLSSNLSLAEETVKDKKTKEEISIIKKIDGWVVGIMNTGGVIFIKPD
ncbi:hypothetical protein CJF42_25675 [Pseudoalteromonas sp. NBT06-2]|uniref:hypothetical protein n=1 Tax=Pseudoalteromonas sp. NBT06-2 TaxID=2025950 RepID=UPI000BA535BF|nr:hypothetical protein [Pseudoalteromonas sp. NBT06-2]PAJ71635.1 hypothetical protein CJF42_25675 [Pseudoalteromonas sp. NBT06-2]